MDAASPAAWPPLPFKQFRTYPSYVLLPSFRFLDGYRPAYSLIASKRRQAIPHCRRARRSEQGVAQIFRDLMRYPGSDSYIGHIFKVINLINQVNYTRFLPLFHLIALIRSSFVGNPYARKLGYISLLLPNFNDIFIGSKDKYMNFETSPAKDLGKSQAETFQAKKEDLEKVKSIIEENFGPEAISRETVMEMLDIRREIKEEIERNGFLADLDDASKGRIRSLAALIRDPKSTNEKIGGISGETPEEMRVEYTDGHSEPLSPDDFELLDSLNLYFDSYRLAHNAAQFRKNVKEAETAIIEDNKAHKANFYSPGEKEEAIIPLLQEKYQQAGFSQDEIKELVKTCDLKGLAELPIHEIKAMNKIKEVFSRFMDGDKSKYIGLSAALMVPAFIDGYAPILFANAFRNNTFELEQIILFSLASLGSAGLNHAIQGRYKDFLNQNFSKEGGISEEASRNITELPADEAKKFGNETVKERTKAGISGYEKIFQSISFEVIPAITTVITSAVVLTDRSPMMAAGAIVGSGIVVALNKYLTKKTRFWEKQGAGQRDSEEAVKKLDEQLSAHMEVILAGEKDRFFKEIKSSLEKNKASESEVRFLNVIQDNFYRFGSAINWTLLGLAGMLAGGSSDKVIAAILYSANFSRGIEDIMRSHKVLLEAARDITQMELMFNGHAQEEAENEKSRIAIEDVKGNDISLEHVKVEIGNKKILDDISLHIPAGAMTYIEGASGAGKTTLMKVISGYYRPNFGEVRLGDTAVEDIKKSGKGSIYDHIAYLSQFPYLFDDTIKNNLKFGQKGEISDQQIKEALKEVRLDKRFGNLNEAISGGAGDTGTASGGEASRLGLARILLKLRSGGAKIVFLDEPTASVDKQTKKEIADIINAEKAKRPETTFIIISHDEKFVELLDCTQKIEMENGRIIEG